MGFFPARVSAMVFSPSLVHHSRLVPLPHLCAFEWLFASGTEFVRLWAVVFLPRETCVSILCEETWLHSSLLEIAALHSEVCTHEYRSECLSKSPEQIYGSVTWVRAGRLMIGELYFTIQQLSAARSESLWFLRGGCIFTLSCYARKGEFSSSLTDIS